MAINITTKALGRRRTISAYIQGGALGAGQLGGGSFQAPSNGWLTNWAGSIAMNDNGDQTFGIGVLSTVLYTAVTDLVPGLQTILAVTFIEMGQVAGGGLTTRQNSFSVPLSYRILGGQIVYGLAGGSSTPAVYGVIQFEPD